MRINETEQLNETERLDVGDLRLLFMGRTGSALSLHVLERLLASGIQPVAVCIDHKHGKGLSPTAHAAAKRVYSVAANSLRRQGVPIKHYRYLRELVDTHRIEHFDCAEINAPQTVDRIRALEPDLIVIAGFGRILNTAVINLPTLACINVHPSLLPKYRGPIPYCGVLRHGESITGVTIHHATRDIDAGDIILQREISVAADETEHSLRKKTLPVAAALLIEAIRLIANGTAPRIPQDERAASYFSYHGLRGGNNIR